VQQLKQLAEIAHWQCIPLISLALASKWGSHSLFDESGAFIVKESIQSSQQIVITHVERTCGCFGQSAATQAAKGNVAKNHM
jgi:hypothetical protein